MSNQATTNDIDLFNELLSQSKYTSVFTGAGISTESGIPDFRSPGGYWTKNKPIYFQDFIQSQAVRRSAWKRVFDSSLNLESAEPNSGHQVTAAWYKRGLVKTVITQNIDNLHQKSGIPPHDVIELHGNASYAKCLRCGHIYQFSELEHDYRKNGTVSPCRQSLGQQVCAGIIKSATISFGQAMPEEEMSRAEEASLKSELFIVLGSSLVVYPAASFPELAKRNGAKLIIVNREPTGLDSLADIVLHYEIGDTLKRVNAVLMANI